MKNAIVLGSVLLLTTSIVQAGGLDRAGNAYSVLFEDGNYAQLSFSSTTPDVSGDFPGTVGGGTTDNMANNYTSVGFALKYGITDKIDLAVFLNQPFGADAEYTTGFYEGLTAIWESNQAAAVVKYQAAPRIAVYGGLRAVQSKAEIMIPDQLIRAGIASQIPDPLPSINPLPDALQNAIALVQSPDGALSYSAKTDQNTQVGYIIGAAYERPEIALRVALTYESGLTHDFGSSETLPAIGADSSRGTFNIEMPQSVTLDFQSGVATDTLVFGSIRWSEWSVWEVRPSVYEGLTGDRVTGLDDDVYTYRLGVGRRISEDLSVFARVTYEDAQGGISSRLAPTDGLASYGIGGSYTIDAVEITGGIEYAVLGDANDGLTEFQNNTALGFGLNIGYSF
ncbi:long-subunit fatty acid transport protein [Loktanella sp. PT4BL]|jgi:long-subunit fatty acid transport protein|uniref:outer membrane protein transport protein n=1 Tax=Loktanella sp. PT4BL TaxID=2135611 RepID=UPI000D752294|nr:outer membrane protein transport protein [Loktanella sp. PT4BL]PXW66244.1 long-subunit fatty acid transport protein [Loktanella sp. PT4BL]